MTKPAYIIYLCPPSR